MLLNCDQRLLLSKLIQLSIDKSCPLLAIKSKQDDSQEFLQSHHISYKPAEPRAQVY